jgi:hypothetical protein
MALTEGILLALVFLTIIFLALADSPQMYPG